MHLEDKFAAEGDMNLPRTLTPAETWSRRCQDRLYSDGALSVWRSGP